MDLSLGSISLWGFVGTLVLTLVQSAAQGLHVTRMSLPLMLGTMVTGDPDRARASGFILHFFAGWVFSLVYALIFEALDMATWWLGMILGLLHGLFALAVLIPNLPSVHSRMAGEFQPPQAVALLEPPGFMVLNYGPRTPIVAVIAHLLYGGILGAFYHLAPAL